MFRVKVRVRDWVRVRVRLGVRASLNIWVRKRTSDQFFCRLHADSFI